MWPALLAIYVANSPSAAASFRRDDEVGLSSSSAVTSSTRHSMSSSASGALPCHSNHLIRSSAAALALAVVASVRALLIICPSTVSRMATWNQSRHGSGVLTEVRSADIGNAVVSAMDAKAVQMIVIPPHEDLDHPVQLGNR